MTCFPQLCRERDGQWTRTSTQKEMFLLYHASVTYLVLTLFVCVTLTFNFSFSPSFSVQKNPSLKLEAVCLIHSSDVNVSHDLSTVRTHMHTLAHTETDTHARAMNTSFLAPTTWERDSLLILCESLGECVCVCITSYLGVCK